MRTGAKLVKQSVNVKDPRGVVELYGGLHFVPPFVMRFP
jgi:hypothetical protein